MSPTGVVGIVDAVAVVAAVDAPRTELPPIFITLAVDGTHPLMDAKEIRITYDPDRHRPLMGSPIRLSEYELEAHDLNPTLADIATHAGTAFRVDQLAYETSTERNRIIFIRARSVERPQVCLTITFGTKLVVLSWQ